MYKIFLTFRYLRKRRIAYFAIMSVALCVAMVLVVHSVMTGFLDTVRNSSRRLLGDVILEIGGMETFPYYDEFIAELRTKMGDRVVAATPVIINYGLLKILGGAEMDRTFPVMINGIRLDEYMTINGFGDGLYYSKYYPGTTTLSEARMPVWYYDSNGLARLPQEYEQARARYWDSAPAEEGQDLFARRPGRPYPGPGRWEAELADGDEPTTGYIGDPLPGMIIGVEIVAYRKSDASYQRDVPKGAKIRLTVLALTRSGDLSATEPAPTRAFRYADDSRTKIYDIDKQNVYVDFDLLQKMLGLHALEYADGSGFAPSRAAQIQVKLANGVDFNAARDDIDALWQDFAVRMADRCQDPIDAMILKYMQILTWEQRNSAFINAVEKERILVLILFGIISLVAVLLVGCIFYMIVQEKTREIGIIKSMGASSRGVAGIFLIYALGIGVVGSAIGVTIGALFVRYINEFQDFIANHIHPSLRVWSAETYAFDRIPDVVKPFDAVVIVVVAILASIFGSLAAARKAARVWPVAAIRYE